MAVSWVMMGDMWQCGVCYWAVPAVTGHAVGLLGVAGYCWCMVGECWECAGGSRRECAGNV